MCALLEGGRNGLSVGKQNLLESGLCRSAIPRVGQTADCPSECVKSTFLRLQPPGWAVGRRLDHSGFEDDQNRLLSVYSRVRKSDQSNRTEASNPVSPKIKHANVIKLNAELPG